MLKWLAIASMVCDHVGFIFFPHVFAFRAAGRLAMPIFAAMVGRNATFTADLQAYVLRLLFWACIAQPIYWFAFHDPWYRLNVLFTFAAGLIVADFCDRRCLPWFWLIPALLLVPWVDYQVSGVFVVIFACLAARRLSTLMPWLGLVLAVNWLNSPLFTPFAFLGLAAYLLISYTRLSALDRTLGRLGPRWGFYAFYPAHLAFLATLALFYA
jgi:hypothetical protein